MRGHGLDPVGKPWQVAEKGGQLAVHPFGDKRRVLQQFLRRARVEARVGAQELEESGEIPREAGPAHHLLHLAPDPGHLGETDLVHLVRREVEGREVANAVRVVLAPARQIGGGGGTRRPRRP
jgi:hypothetical protein